MKRASRYAIGLIVALMGVSLCAQELSLEDLGELELDFAPVVTVSEYPGAEITLRAGSLPGDAFEVHLPFRPNRFSRLVQEGRSVTAGEPVARVAGPELVAWVLEAEAVSAQFARAQTRYQANRPLFEQGALSAALWASIAEEYFRLQGEMHHVEHVLEVLHVEDGAKEAELLAPVDGRVLFPDTWKANEDEVIVATVLQPGSLRLHGLFGAPPGRGDQDPVAVSVGECRVAVDLVEASAEGLARRLWTTGSSECLAPAPGAVFAARPLYADSAFAVPRPALLRHEGRSGVLLRVGYRLRFVPVSILSEDERRFFIGDTAGLQGQDVLTRSVSSVQGLLLGLGSD